MANCLFMFAQRKGLKMAKSLFVFCPKRISLNMPKHLLMFIKKYDVNLRNMGLDDGTKMKLDLSFIMVHSHQIICSRLSDLTAKNWVRNPLLPTV